MILIPEWVLEEILDSEISVSYVEGLIAKGYPIFKIAEEKYSSFVDEQEWNLYQIVKASANQLGQVKGYLRRYVEKADPLDMDAYAEWIKKLYDEWPISGSTLSSGRRKKKNAGEVSITILAEMISWAEDQLRKVFASRISVPVSYKSNDAILCQLYRMGAISEEDICGERKAGRKITYSKVMDDKSVALVTELLDTNDFISLVKDSSVQIVF